MGVPVKLTNGERLFYGLAIIILAIAIFATRRDNIQPKLIANAGAAQSAVGRVGAVGPVGPAGKDGATGQAGLTGARGPIGLPGLPGTNGTNGSAGANGQNGTNGNTYIATITAESTSGVLDLNETETFPVNPDGSYGEWKRHDSTPLMTFAPGATVFSFGKLQVDNVNTMQHAYAVVATIIIMNQDRTVRWTYLIPAIAAAGQASASGTSNTILPTETTKVGSDLQRANNASTVTTTAGGNYSVSISYQGSWL
jgi:hypothetical protein